MSFCNSSGALFKKKISSSSDLLSNNWRAAVKEIKLRARSDLSAYNWSTNSELLLNNSRTRADLFRF